MNIELLTKDDLSDMYSLLSEMNRELKEVKQKLFAAEDKTLISKDIREELRISEAVFATRRPALCSFGMFKSGQWKMKASDLQRYIAHQKNN